MVVHPAAPPMPVAVQGIGAKLRDRRGVDELRCLQNPGWPVVAMPQPRPDFVFPEDTHLHVEVTARYGAVPTGCEGELVPKTMAGAGHDLRRAIYGPRDAKCTVCVRCGKLWWCPEPTPGMMPATCEDKRIDGPLITPGLAWVEGIRDALLDQANQALIDLGMGMPAADYRRQAGLPEAA